MNNSVAFTKIPNTQKIKRKKRTDNLAALYLVKTYLYFLIKIISVHNNEME